MPRGVLAAAALGALASLPAAALDFRVTQEPATVLYDAPSTKAKPVLVLGRDYPLEVIVSLEGWLKVRDATGALAWVERKAVVERRVALVRARVAEVLARPEEGAPLVFRAEEGVVLEPLEAPQTGWVRVRHRDGATGYARVGELWGL